MMTPWQLRDYQQVAVDHALPRLLGGQPGDRFLYAAPTGTGKSLILLELQRLLPAAWIITPRVEIVRGFLEKMGYPVPPSENDLIERAWVLGITTPLRLRNVMLRGDFTEDVSHLLFDEGHHLEAESWRQVELLAGRVPSLAVTATPYRGTPRGTQAFRESWGEPTWVLTYPEAVERGVLSLPSVRVVPLVDDDTIEVTNGEFTVARVEEAVRSRLDAAVDLVRGWYGGPVAEITRFEDLGYERVAGHLDRPTMCSLPTREAAWDFQRRLEAAGIPGLCVTGETPDALRQEAFRFCVARKCILVQVQVVSEGVDLPVRRLLDLSPTLSPVRWLQQLGRITRPVGPGEPPPEYLCTNRNLLRHAYLLEGCLPPGTLAAAQRAFPESNASRAGLRVLGLEAVGRLRPAPLPLADGSRGHLYAFSAVEGAAVRQYVVLLRPDCEDPIWATRNNGVKGDGTRDYGRWARCDPPAELTGYASLPGSPVSEKQLAWWKRSAARHGLDPAHEPTRKTFAALPVLSDLGANKQWTFASRSRSPTSTSGPRS